LFCFFSFIYYFKNNSTSCLLDSDVQTGGGNGVICPVDDGDGVICPVDDGDEVICLLNKNGDEDDETYCLVLDGDDARDPIITSFVTISTKFSITRANTPCNEFSESKLEKLLLLIPLYEELVIV
jgi:hypothetical protein